MERMMTGDICLRLYEHDDEEVVIQLWLRTWKVAYPDIDFDERLEWFRRYWKDKLVPYAHIVLAERAGTVVGFYTIDLVTPYIDQFLAAPEEWGSDLATTLMDDAKRCSPRGIDLRVNAKNSRALRFYEKNRFTNVGYERNSTGNLVYLMRWQS